MSDGPPGRRDDAAAGGVISCGHAATRRQHRPRGAEGAGPSDHGRHLPCGDDPGRRRRRCRAAGHGRGHRRARPLIGFRDLEGQLSCVVGIGSEAWDRIVAPAPPSSRPQGLHPFRAIESAGRVAPSTPGDLLFHIRATRFDLCFELAATILRRLGPNVSSADEVHGFRYFEARDLLGFVDGTENPTGDAMAHAALIGAEDPDYRRRELRHRPEVPARPRRLERLVGRGAGTGHRADEARGHRVRRRRQAGQRPHRVERDRGGRRGDRHPARQHAVRLRGVRRVRHVFHRLRPGPGDDRGDAAEHVRRQPRGQLRRASWISRRRSPGRLYFVPSLPLLESLSGIAAAAADDAAPPVAPGHPRPRTTAHWASARCAEAQPGRRRGALRSALSIRAGQPPRPRRGGVRRRKGFLLFLVDLRVLVRALLVGESVVRGHVRPSCTGTSIGVGRRRSNWPARGRGCTRLARCAETGHVERGP